MQPMKTWGGMAGRLMAFILVTFFAVGPAFGQQSTMRLEIPYEFTFGSKVLPAGTYTFSVDNSSLRVQSASSRATFTALVLVRLGGPAEFLRDGSLVFDKTDGGRILSEVWMPGTEGILLHRTPKNHRRDFLIGSDQNHTRTVSGRAAFNLTCGRCHGQDGRGDERADKFFNIKIPRLTSPEVQGKSDAELREQITQGRGAMPPVEIDESGFRHRLPPQDVDAVIAYVRSLKP